MYDVIEKIAARMDGDVYINEEAVQINWNDIKSKVATLEKSAKEITTAAGNNSAEGMYKAMADMMDGMSEVLVRTGSKDAALKFKALANDVKKVVGTVVPAVAAEK